MITKLSFTVSGALPLTYVVGVHFDNREQAEAFFQKVKQQGRVQADPFAKDSQDILDRVKHHVAEIARLSAEDEDKAKKPPRTAQNQRIQG